MISNKKSSNLWLSSFVLLLFSFSSRACICPEMKRLSVETCGFYDFIAYGRVDSEIDCSNSGALLFSPVELFKGDASGDLILYTDCKDCGVSFSKGEYWIVFGNKNNAQEIQVNQCSFTRNQLPDTVQDYSEVVRGTKFEDDLVFLKNNFESKVDDKNELKAKKYEKVDPELVPVFLGISLVFMLIGFLVIKRIGKRNS